MEARGAGSMAVMRVARPASAMARGQEARRMAGADLDDRAGRSRPHDGIGGGGIEARKPALAASANPARSPADGAQAPLDNASMRRGSRGRRCAAANSGLQRGIGGPARRWRMAIGDEPAAPRQPVTVMRPNRSRRGALMAARRQGAARRAPGLPATLPGNWPGIFHGGFCRGLPFAPRPCPRSWRRPGRAGATRRAP